MTDNACVRQGEEHSNEVVSSRIVTKPVPCGNRRPIALMCGVWSVWVLGVEQDAPALPGMRIVA